ncbi:MAG: ABC transporter permease [Solirubrobacterales bacterium]
MSTTAEATQHQLETVIEPPRGWTPLSIRELWEYRELIYFLTKRELQVRYKQSFFGVSWVVLQPLIFAFVFALFFGRVLKVSSEGFPYPVFAIVGLVPWLFTAQAISNGATSLVQDSNLIQKVYFPRLALPISKALSLMVDIGIALVVVVGVTLLYGVSIASTAWLMPAFLMLGIVTAFGIGTLLAAINVRYRDVEVVVPMFVQVMFFLSPVLYPGTLVSGDWAYIYALNPMASVLNGSRWALLGAPYPGTAEILISIGSAAVLLLVALYYFRRTEHYFADIV